VLHAKLKNRTCQGLDRQGKGPGQGLDLQEQGLKLVLKESLRIRINITGVCGSVCGWTVAKPTMKSHYHCQ